VCEVNSLTASMVLSTWVMDAGLTNRRRHAVLSLQAQLGRGHAAAVDDVQVATQQLAVSSKSRGKPCKRTPGSSSRPLKVAARIAAQPIRGCHSWAEVALRGSLRLRYPQLEGVTSALHLRHPLQRRRGGRAIALPTKSKTVRKEQWGAKMRTNAETAAGLGMPFAWLRSERATKTLSSAFAKFAALALMISAVTSYAGGAASFEYDDIGRLVRVIAADGTSTQYTYDAAGNLTAVTANAAATIGISSIAPENGAGGTVLTINGNGFSTTASNNTVTIGGVATAVSQASATSLTVTVPTTAVTGSVVVKNSNGSATSPHSFTVNTIVVNGPPAVLDPTKTGFSTTYGFFGTSGQSLGLALTGLSLSDASGLVQTSVVNPDGTSPANASVNCQGATQIYGCKIELAPLTQTGYYLVHVVSVNSASITTGTLTLSSDQTATLVAGTPQGIALRDGQIARMKFNGTAGQTPSLATQGLKNTTAVPSGDSPPIVNAKVWDPSGNLVFNNSLVLMNASAAYPSAGDPWIQLPALPATGTYTLTLDPNDAVPVSGSLALNPASTTLLTVNAAAANVSLGSATTLTFSTTAGSTLGLGLSNIMPAVGNATPTLSLTSVVAPGGSTVPATLVCDGGWNCSLRLQNLVQAGTYQVKLTSDVPALAKATLSTDSTGTLTVGTPYPLSLKAGQAGMLSFSATVGVPQYLALSNLTIGWGAGGSALTVFNPSGSQVLAQNVNQATASVTLPVPTATGTYKVLVVPNAGVATTASILLSGAQAVPVTVNGASVNLGATAGAYATFSGSTGQVIGIGVTGVVATGSPLSVVVKTPDGASWSTQTMTPTTNPNANFVLASLPQTGTYQVFLVPATGSSLTSATLTLSTDLTGGLTTGQAANFSLRPGQRVVFTFNGTAGQNPLLAFSGLSTNPVSAFGTQALVANIYQPNGQYFQAERFSGSEDNLQVQTLPATGTYKLVIAADSGSGSGSVTLNPPAASIAVDGNSVNLGTFAGGNGMATFTGTAGQVVDIGFSSVTASSSVSIPVSVAINKPDGTSLTVFSCGSGGVASACDAVLPSLPSAGAYKIAVTSSSGSVASAIATLSSELTVPLTANTGTPLSNRSGQRVRLRINAVQGQQAYFAVGSLNTSVPFAPLTATLIDPSNNSTSVGSFDPTKPLLALPLWPSTGTYTLVLDAAGATFTTAVTLNPSAAVAVDGSPSDLYAASGHMLSFSATAGQELGVGLSNLNLASYGGQSVGPATLQIVGANGSVLAQNVNCLAPGCTAFLTSAPSSGTYSVRLLTPYMSATSASVQVSSDKVVAVTAGTPASISARQAQNARLTFSGTSGAAATVRLQSILTPGSHWLTATVLKPDNTTALAQQQIQAPGAVLYLPSLPASGTYTVLLGSDNGSPFSLTSLLNAPDDMVSDSTPHAVAPGAPNEDLLLQFQVVAGKRYNIALTGLAFGSGNGSAQLGVYGPNGSFVAYPAATYCGTYNATGVQCYASVLATTSGPALIDLPTTSTASPSAGTITLTTDKVAAITSGTPAKFTLQPAQSQRYTFPGTVGQMVAIDVTGLATTPVRQVITASVLGPSGNVITQGSAYGDIPLLVQSLPTAGTYTIVVSSVTSSSVSGTVFMSVVGQTATIDAASPLALPSIASGNAVAIAINGTSGQALGVGVSQPAGGGLSVQFVAPAGLPVDGWISCYSSFPCGISRTALPATGTYIFWVQNLGTSAYAPTVTASSPKAVTLSPGVATPVSLRIEQEGLLSFSATAGQAVTFRFTAINRPPSNNLSLSVQAPAGVGYVGSNTYGDASGMVLFIPSIPSSGTYSVVVQPDVAGTFTVGLAPSAEITAGNAAITMTGSGAGSNANLLFYGTAGQNLGVSLAGLTMSGGSAGSDVLQIIGPSGFWQWQNGNCASTNPGGSCGIDMPNLPSTGPYLIAFLNNQGGTLTSSKVTLSVDAVGTLTAGQLFNASLRAGQSGNYTFTAVAGSHTLKIGATTCTPSGVQTSVTVTKVGGSQVASGSIASTGGTLNLSGLSAATYSAFVNPTYGAQCTVPLTYQ
jgi:YD repeat-containing protein